jgi:cytochrome c biogenesis factor
VGIFLISLAVICVVAAAVIPFAFLKRHPGKTMDAPGYRHWLVSMFVLIAVCLASLVLIVTVTKSIS